MSEKIKIGGKQWHSSIKLKPGIYSPKGEYLGSLKDSQSHEAEGNLVVTERGEIKKYAMALGQLRLGPTKFNTKSISNIPQPLRKHSTETRVEGRWVGGSGRKRFIRTPGGERKEFKYQNGGFVSKDTPETVSPDLEKELDRAWTVRNKPPVKSAFDTIEGFNLATSRYNDWNEAKKKHGTTFNKLDANNKLDDKEQNYAYVVNQEGWTKGNLLQEIPLRNQKGGKLHDIKDIIERNQWLVKPKEWEEVHGEPPPKNVFQNQSQTQSPSTTPSIAQSSTRGLGIKDGDTIAIANIQKPQKNNLDYGDGTDNTNLSSYEQDATTSWGRGSYNTKGTTKDLKSRNQRTMAYWGGNQEQGGKGYDFSGYRGDDRDLARALRTGEAWETGKGTIIYQPDRGPMQVFKQSPTKPIIEKGPGDNIASNKKVQNNA